MSTPSPQPSPLYVVVPIVLVALVFAAFFPALGADFLRYDDQVLITNNAAYRGFGPANLHFMWTATTLGHYQPLTWMSYALDYTLWGMDPRGYHLTNVLLHAINAVLVFVLTLRLFALTQRTDETPSPRSGAGVVLAAGLAAALFALHPLRVESVAWVTERRDVLSAAFLLGATILYLRSVNIGKPGVRSVPLFLACVALLTLSLLSKAWGMSFFVLMLVLDWCPLGRLKLDSPTRLRDGLRLVVEKTPMIVLGVAAAAKAGIAQNDALAAKTIEEWGVLERVVQSFYGLGFYIQRTLMPSDLSPLYALPKQVDPFEPRYLAAYALVLAGVLAAVGFAKRVPAVLAAALVYGVCVAPVLGVFQSGDQFVADRYSYLACIPFAVLLAGGSVAMAQRRRELRPMLVGAAALAVVALSVLTYRQSTHWRDTESLWRRAVQVEPNDIVWTNFGIELSHNDKPVEAVKAYVEAVKLYEGNGRAWYSMANTLRDLKQYAGAEEAYKEAIKHADQAYVPLVNLGSMYLNDLNRPDDAVAMFRAAVADIEKGGRRPLSALPYLALGHALGNTGDLRGARVMLTKALDFPETRAEAQAKLKRLDAIEQK